MPRLRSANWKTSSRSAILYGPVMLLRGGERLRDQLRALVGKPHAATERRENAKCPEDRRPDEPQRRRPLARQAVITQRPAPASSGGGATRCPPNGRERPRPFCCRPGRRRARERSSE